MVRNIILANEVNVTPKIEAFPYQREAAEAIQNLDYCGVFHEQGLGKTKIAIDVALYWLSNDVVDSVIIVTKKGLVQNWVRELKAHTHLNPKLLTQDSKNNFYALNSPARLYLTHYEAILGEKERIKLLQASRSVAVIMDEAHKIKNPESKLAQAFHELSLGFARKLILTGTPVANRVYDFWSQIYFLDQGRSLGADFATFKSEFDLPSVERLSGHALEEYEERLSGLYERISDFSVRETKSGSGISLPEKEYITHFAEWESVQQELYDSYRDELGAIVVKEGVPKEDKAEDLLKRILRLVQIASNPKVVDASYDKTPGKFEILEQLVSKIVSDHEKVIVWTSFTDNADWLTRELSEYNSVKVHGKLSIEDRNKSVETFMNDESCKVLVATPGAAKEGLTLTMANHVIFYDRTFSLDDYLQAQDRIHRISQTKKCFVHNIVMPDSVDIWIDEILDAKHWSAKLAQGDVTLEKYRANIDYDFQATMREILGIEQEGGNEH